jgi:nucleoside-triphosphatase
MTDSPQQKILLTGAPGCGKTTVIRQLAELLKTIRLAGFYTAEICDGNQRTGFQAHTFDNQEALLSSIHHKSWVSVGRYGVDVLGFEKLVLPELQRDPNTVDLFLIDEIGKMECFCPRFVEAMNALLALDAPLVATVSLHGKGLIQDIKLRDDVDIITVNPQNRDTLPKLILNRFRN